MRIEQRLILVRAFRQLQEGVLKGLELTDACGKGDIDRPEDLAELAAHLGKLEEHARVMQEAVANYMGANALLATVTRTVFKKVPSSIGQM